MIDHLRRGLLLSFFMGMAACTPQIAPPFQDFKYPTAQTSPASLNLAAIFQAQGWMFHSQTQQTEVRQIKDFGAYKLLLSLEVISFQNKYLRIYTHTFRKYKLSGRQAKVPYLERNVKRAIEPIFQALKSAGFRIEAVPPNRF